MNRRDEQSCTDPPAHRLESDGYPSVSERRTWRQPASRLPVVGGTENRGVYHVIFFTRSQAHCSQRSGKKEFDLNYPRSQLQRHVVYNFDSVTVAWARLVTSALALRPQALISAWSLKPCQCVSDQLTRTQVQRIELQFSATVLPTSSFVDLLAPVPGRASMAQPGRPSHGPLRLEP